MIPTPIFGGSASSCTQLAGSLFDSVLTNCEGLYAHFLWAQAFA